MIKNNDMENIIRLNVPELIFGSRLEELGITKDNNYMVDCGKGVKVHQSDLHLLLQLLTDNFKIIKDHNREEGFVKGITTSKEPNFYFKCGFSETDVNNPYIKEKPDYDYIATIEFNLDKRSFNTNKYDKLSYYSSVEFEQMSKYLLSHEILELPNNFKFMEDESTVQNPFTVGNALVSLCFQVTKFNDKKKSKSKSKSKSKKSKNVSVDENKDTDTDVNSEKE